ncbi:enoyl-CoA hydratase-related protein [Nocardia sp. NPDC004860]|uniref:enoyl-CoA hydratase/isomerase family protein n=1 Tax=Nocardia sp. NPDC004860 TaxID=3154557 RepID=UPI0033BF87BA
MTDLAHGCIKLEADATIARITLNRPDRGNAFDLAMAEDFLEAAETVCDRVGKGLRVVILDAAGPMFCVGGDLQAFASTDAPGELMRQVTSKSNRAIELLTSAAVPVVTVVQGTAAGGGIGIMSAGDIIIAVDTAKFRMAYTAVGLTPDFGTSWLLTRDLGLARALDLTLTNRVFTATEAHSWGLISRTADPENLAVDVEATVNLLAAGSTATLAEAKKLLRDTSSVDFSARLLREAETISRMVNEPAAYEGIDAFLNRREPKFS